MRRTLILMVGVVGLLALQGCAKDFPMDTDKKRQFTYDYEVKGVDKETLWIRARNYFAETYGDSREVFRVQSKEEGLLIGRGLATWTIALTARCTSKYKIAFKSKNERARLRLKIVKGVPAVSDCPAWPLPSAGGYEEMKAEFQTISGELGKRLKAGSDLADF